MVVVPNTPIPMWIPFQDSAARTTGLLEGNLTFNNVNNTKAP